MNTEYCKPPKTFILMLIVIILTACSSSHKSHKSGYVNLNGKYSTEKSETQYSAIIQKDSIKFFRQSFRDQMDGSRVWSDSCPVMCASGTFYKARNYIIAKTIPIYPIEDVDISYTSAESDSTTLTLRFPNYDFSKGTYPIVKLAVLFTRGNPFAHRGDPDYMKPEYYEMEIECRTDNTVVNLPRYMKQEGYFIDISQSKYINKYTDISPYLCKLSYFWIFETRLTEDSKENVIITFPDLTNQVFETMSFERVFIPYDKDHLYFFNIDLKKETTESE